MEYVIVIYFAAMNILAFAAMGRDKRRAERGERRTPEATLLSLAVLGGSAGALLGMLLFRHKTKKSAFFLGVPVILAVQIALALLLHRI